ncbi:MAG: hypothetical protein KZQ77_19515 [Candidatus Thiodiazotropha sp. (ex Notomyrtea botanica)]|nr:hypothetical protein [Candidatus Thiodiazotropha sp. (ex Notomyrtea botanica)]
MDLSGLYSYFNELITELMEYVKTFVLWVWQSIWDAMLDAMAHIIELIPVPSFLQSASGVFSSIPGEVAFFAGALEITYGIGVIVAAWGIRFLIRRLPIVG